MLGTEDHYEGQKISAKDTRSVVRSTKALHEVRHEVHGPDAYMGFLHEVYAKFSLPETSKMAEALQISHSWSPFAV